MDATLRNLEVQFRKDQMCSVQAHEKASTMAAAYCIGRTESAAAIALLHKIPAPIVSKLTQVVRCDSQRRPVTWQDLRDAEVRDA